MKLLILEPNLRDFGGHEAEEGFALAVAARQRGLDVEVVAHRHVTQDVRNKFRAASIRLSPRFNLDRDFGLAPARWLANSWAICRLLVSRFRSEHPPQVAFLVETRPDVLLGVALASLFAPPQSVFVAQFFDWERGVSNLTSKDTALLLRQFLRLAVTSAQLAADRGRFIPMGQMEGVADELSRVFGSPVASLPLAIDWQQSHAPRAATASPTIGFLGNTRPEKGFETFVQSTSHLTQDYQLRALATISTSSRQARCERAALVDLLEDDSRHEVVRTPVSTTKYRQLLDSLDIVVLPYLVEQYRNRGSRIFAEAVGAEKIVVTNRNIMIGKIVEREGIGTTYDEQAPRALASAIDKAIARRAIFESRLHEFAPQWRELHCATSVLDRLLETTAAVLSAHRASKCF